MRSISIASNENPSRSFEGAPAPAVPSNDRGDGFSFD